MLPPVNRGSSSFDSDTAWEWRLRLVLFDESTLEDLPDRLGVDYLRNQHAHIRTTLGRIEEQDAKHTRRLTDAERQRQDMVSFIDNRVTEQVTSQTQDVSTRTIVRIIRNDPTARTVITHAVRTQVTAINEQTRPTPPDHTDATAEIQVNAAMNTAINTAVNEVVNTTISTLVTNAVDREVNSFQQSTNHRIGTTEALINNQEHRFREFNNVISRLDSVDNGVVHMEETHTQQFDNLSSRFDTRTRDRETRGDDHSSSMPYGVRTPVRNSSTLHATKNTDKQDAPSFFAAYSTGSDGQPRNRQGKRKTTQPKQQQQQTTKYKSYTRRNNINATGQTRMRHHQRKIRENPQEMMTTMMMTPLSVDDNPHANHRGRRRNAEAKKKKTMMKTMRAKTHEATGPIAAFLPPPIAATCVTCSTVPSR